jgi:uncharacterized protein (TIGR02118 family)
MVKLVYILRARADVDPTEFHRYWLEEHGPKVRSVAAQIRARRYVQSHTLDTPLNAALVASRGMSPGYEGITEVWLDSLSDLEAATADPEAVEALAMLAEDEGRFIDLARSTIFLTEEHEIFDLTAPASPAATTPAT